MGRAFWRNQDIGVSRQLDTILVQGGEPMSALSRTAVAMMIALTLLFASSAAIAEGEDASPASSITVANLFVWAKSSPIAWGTGGLYAALGIVGSMVTVFSLIGGAIPGTSGFAKIEADMKRVEEREKIIDKLIRAENKDPEVISAIEKATDNLRDDLRSDMRQQFALAATLYVVLGAFFAAALAQDLLQALVIGAGWTAYLGAFGLKRDYAERKSIKDKATEELEAALPPPPAPDPATGFAAMTDPWGDVRMEARVSRSI